MSGIKISFFLGFILNDPKQQENIPFISKPRKYADQIVRTHNLINVVLGAL